MADKQVGTGKPSLPDIARAQKGLSARQLYRSTPSYFKAKSTDDFVTIKKLEHKKTKGGMPAIVAQAVSMGQKPPRRIHKCSIIGYDKTNQKIYNQKKVVVSCDCESYCFTFEYANWTWGASRIVYSNGEPAVVKNAGNRPGLCKHLVALVKTVAEHKL